MDVTLRYRQKVDFNRCAEMVDLPKDGHIYLLLIIMSLGNFSGHFCSYVTMLCVLRIQVFNLLDPPLPIAIYLFHKAFTRHSVIHLQTFYQRSAQIFAARKQIGGTRFLSSLLLQVTASTLVIKLYSYSTYVSNLYCIYFIVILVSHFQITIFIGHHCL